MDLTRQEQGSPPPRRRPGTINDVFPEGREKPHRRPSSIRPFVWGGFPQVRVQRWLLPFEQE